MLGHVIWSRCLLHVLMAQTLKRVFLHPGWRPLPEIPSWWTNPSLTWRDLVSWFILVVWLQCRSTRSTSKRTQSKVSWLYSVTRLWNRRCCFFPHAPKWCMFLFQLKVRGSGEELTSRSRECRSTPSPSSSTRKSLSPCTKRCPPIRLREISKIPLQRWRATHTHWSVYVAG